MFDSRSRIWGWQRHVGDIGAAALATGRAARGVWNVHVGTLAGLIRRISGRHRLGRPRGEILRQLYWIGNRSVVFIAVTLGSIGMVATYEACLQVSRVTGDYSQVGGQLLRLVVSDVAPVLTGMMLSTRVGAGIAAEIGSMKVTEQIDALRMSGVVPIDYLLVPRFVAAQVMTLFLSVLGGVVMFTAGGLTARHSFGVSPAVFFDFSYVHHRHLVLLVVKSAAFGAAIPVVSGYFGLHARGSSEGVGAATTAAVIGSSFAVIILDFVISAANLMTGGEL